MSAAKAVSPPAEVMDFHVKHLLLLRYLESLLGEQPRADAVDPLITFSVSAPDRAGPRGSGQPGRRCPRTVGGSGLHRGLRRILRESEDDHGNDFENATPVAVGEAVEGSLGVGGDRDAFVIFMDWEPRCATRPGPAGPARRHGTCHEGAPILKDRLDAETAHTCQARMSAIPQGRCRHGWAVGGAETTRRKAMRAGIIGMPFPGIAPAGVD